MSERAKSSPRQFGFVFAAFFVILGLSPWLLHHEQVRVWALAAASIVALVAVVAPSFLAPVDRRWRQIGLILHHVTNPVFMAFIYFVGFVPIGVAIRLSGRELLRMKREPNAESYWIARTPPAIVPRSMSRQF